MNYKNPPFVLAGAVVLLLVQSISTSGSYSSLQNRVEDALPFFNFDLDKVSTSETVPRYKLPTNVIPSHYVLKQRPILDEIDGFTRFTAPSEITITVECVEATSVITLHTYTDKVTITENDVKVTDSTGTEIVITDQEFGDNDFYNITLATPLGLGIYNIFIPFVANISTDSPFGLSGPSYVDPEKPDELSYMTVTTLEPHYARRVFPCFDEPSLKATFDIIIGHTSDYQTLSHTKIARPEQDGDWTWDHYERTVIMPTYLICMVVVSATAYKGVFDENELFNKPVGVWGASNSIDRGAGDFAVETSAKSLDYFEKEYRFDYSLSKLDSIVIPGFPAGALENWGINTYRETVLLYEPSENTQANKGSSASTISHEISHQWFGNLVSCGEWEHIWLNEGFANYMAFRGVAATNPEFDPHASFASDSVQPALRADQGPNTHPVVFEEMPADWMNIFDTISYSKGGSLLKMTEAFLTEEILTQGLIGFLEKMQYKGALQDDLFASLEEAVNQAPVSPLPADLTVKEILDTWTLQSGYPLIRVMKAGSSRIYVTQEKFSLTAGQPQPDLLWHVPLKLVTKSKPSTNNNAPDFWLRKNVLLATFNDGIDTSEWIMVNPDAIGFFRVWYDNPLLALIQAQLESDPTPITPASRSQLLDDYWNFALGHDGNMNTALDLTKYLAKETNLVVWSSVLGNLNPTFTKLSGSEGFVPLEAYLRPRLESALDQIGWEQTPQAIGAPVILRALLLDWTCGFGSEKCQSEAERLVNAWIAQPDPSPVPIPVDLQSIYFCAAVAKLGQPAFDFMLEQYKSTTTSEGLKNKLLRGLACSSDEAILERLLNYALIPAQIRVSDRTFVLQRVAANPSGRNLTYDFVKALIPHPNLGAARFASVISAFSAHWHTEADLSGLMEFIEANGPALEDPNVSASLESSKRNIQANIDWMRTTGTPIVEWMTANGGI